jgi:hypothetical protein
MYKRPYRRGTEELAELNDQIKELLEKGYIRPSSPPCGAPMIFIPKKDGTHWMCVYYHALNKVTVKNKYPSPGIDGLFDQLHSACVFSKIDLRSRLDQPNIGERDIPKTTFILKNGLYK